MPNPLSPALTHALLAMEPTFTYRPYTVTHPARVITLYVLTLFDTVMVTSANVTQHNKTSNSSLQPSISKDADITVEALLALISSLTLSLDAASRLSDAVQNQVVDSDSDLGGNSPVSNSNPSVEVLISSTSNLPAAAGASSGKIDAATKAVATSIQVSQAAGQPRPTPSRHYSVTFNDISLVLPCPEQVGPFYLITQGRLISVIAQWSKVCPLVIGVSGASFNKVSSMEQG
ncbi:hypothetical protein BDN67DRAFT_1014240 [Paxillus ammoniavirescens]|nr:hypothetical protein BDN67DRAFT_1014240 [Paxillus ammoniavirescens]